MTNERRRYFRIDEKIGLHLEVVEKETVSEALQEERDAQAELMSAQDQNIIQLLDKLGETQPDVAELISLINQKLERALGQIARDSSLVNRIAYRVREVNISACGMAFLSDQASEKGSRLNIELELLPSERKIHTQGILVDIDDIDGEQYYWRVDFFSMSKDDEEILIQHIVKRQSAQLKNHLR